MLAKQLKVPGVYGIEIGGKIRLIGRAKNCYNVFHNIKSRLKHRQHENLRLQELYDEEADTIKLILLEKTNGLSELETIEVEDYYLYEHIDTVINLKKNMSKKVEKQRIREEHLNKLREKRRINFMGENNPKAKLTLKAAQEILWLKRNTELNQAQLAEHYKISKSQVSAIGRTNWLNIDPVMPKSYAHIAEEF